MPFQRVFRCVSVGSCAPLRVFSRLEAVIKIGIVVMDPKSYLALVEDRDTPLLLQALHRAGVSAEAFSWHDREVDWSQLDLAVLRTPWDYSQQPAAFDAWLEHAAARTRVLNQPELVRWNMDKRSEERRVGKEWRTRGRAGDGTKKREVGRTREDTQERVEE